MKLKHLYSGLFLAACTALAGCGGNDSSQASQAAQATQKVVLRDKTAATSYNDVVQDLYIAYFGRPADPGGLANFEADLAAANAPTALPSLTLDYTSSASIKALIDIFGNSAESNRLYGNGTTSDFVTAVFQHVLGRPPAAAGLAYWVDAIDNKGLSKGNAAASIMAGAMTNTTTAGLADAQTIKNKVAVASDFTTTLGTSTLYKGQAAAATARNMLTLVTGTTDSSTFQASATATIASITATSGDSAITESSLQACPLASTGDSLNVYSCLVGTIAGVTTSGAANGATVPANLPCTLTIDTTGNITLAAAPVTTSFPYPYLQQHYANIDYYNSAIKAIDPTAFDLGLSLQSAAYATTSGNQIFNLTVISPTLQTIANQGTTNSAKPAITASGIINLNALICTFNI